MVAAQQQPGVVIVILATIGMKTVVPFNTGVSFVYVTVALGWFVAIAQTFLHSFSLNVTNRGNLLATGAAESPTGEIITDIVMSSHHLATASAATPVVTASATVVEERSPVVRLVRRTRRISGDGTRP